MYNNYKMFKMDEVDSDGSMIDSFKDDAIDNIVESSSFLLIAINEGECRCISSMGGGDAIHILSAIVKAKGIIVKGIIDG